jgi:hypothetical protein
MFDKVSAAQPKTTVTAESSMSAAISLLSSKIGEAESQFESLANRLEPVLSPRGGEEGSESPSIIPSCEIEGRILSLAHRIDVLTNFIRSNHHRLCV